MDEGHRVRKKGCGNTFGLSYLEKSPVSVSTHVHGQTQSRTVTADLTIQTNKQINIHHTSCALTSSPLHPFSLAFSLLPPRFTYHYLLLKQPHSLHSPLFFFHSNRTPHTLSSNLTMSKLHFCAPDGPWSGPRPISHHPYLLPLHLHLRSRLPKLITFSLLFLFRIRLAFPFSTHLNRPAHLIHTPRYPFPSPLRALALTLFGIVPKVENM